MSRKYSTTSSDKESNNKTAIVVAIIGLLGTITAAYFAFLGNVQPSVIAISATQTTEARLTPTVTVIEGSKIVFQDAFDNTEGSYDSSIWRCNQECDINSLFLRNGVLNLHRDFGGYTSLVSTINWTTDKLVSLTGDLQIQHDSKYSTGWLQLEDSAGCDINGAEFDAPAPYIQCYYGEYDDELGKHTYDTAQQYIKFDTWHNVIIEFDNYTNQFSFYLDGKPIGEFTPTQKPTVTPVGTGIWVEEDTSIIPAGLQTNGTVLIDNIILRAGK